MAGGSRWRERLVAAALAALMLGAAGVGRGADPARGQILGCDDSRISCEEKATRDGGAPRARGRSVETPTPVPTPPSLEADLDAYWAGRFAAAGLWYVTPGVVPLAGLAGETGCVQSPDLARYSGLYCVTTRTIFYNTEVVERPERWGEEPEWGKVLAHEWGHHVQHLLGITRPPGEAAPWFEMQADCLAAAYFGDGAARGVFGKRYLQSVRHMATHARPGYEATHGTEAEQVAAYDAGYEGGPAACGVPL